MKASKRQQKQDRPYARVDFSKDEMTRIKSGPLSGVNGRGVTTWIRAIAIKELEAYEEKNALRSLPIEAKK